NTRTHRRNVALEAIAGQQLPLRAQLASRRKRVQANQPDRVNVRMPTVANVRHLDRIHAAQDAIHQRTAAKMPTLQHPPITHKQMTQTFTQIIAVANGHRRHHRNDRAAETRNAFRLLDIDGQTASAATDRANAAREMVLAEIRSDQLHQVALVVVPELQPVTALADARPTQPKNQRALFPQSIEQRKRRAFRVTIATEGLLKPLDPTPLSCLAAKLTRKRGFSFSGQTVGHATPPA